MRKLGITFGGLFGLLFLSAFVFYLLCLNHVDVNKVGVAYNSANGVLTVQSTPGWYVTSPLVKVVRLSTLPMVVHVPSEAKVINTKIVRLKPEGVIEFVKLQGFGYNLSSAQENIMMGYAFSGQSFDFLEIIQQGSQETPKK